MVGSATVRVQCFVYCFIVHINDLMAKSKRWLHWIEYMNNRAIYKVHTPLRCSQSSRSFFRSLARARQFIIVCICRMHLLCCVCHRKTKKSGKRKNGSQLHNAQQTYSVTSRNALMSEGCSFFCCFADKMAAKAFRVVNIILSPTLPTFNHFYLLNVRTSMNDANAVQQQKKKLKQLVEITKNRTGRRGVVVEEMKRNRLFHSDNERNTEKKQKENSSITDIRRAQHRMR